MAKSFTFKESQREQRILLRPVLKTGNGTNIQHRLLRSLTITKDGNLRSASCLKRSVKVAAKLKMRRRNYLLKKHESYLQQKQEFNYWDAETVERVCLWKKTRADCQEDQEYLEKLSREAYNFICNPTNDRKLASDKINELEKVTRKLNDNFEQDFIRELGPNVSSRRLYSRGDGPRRYIDIYHPDSFGSHQ
ncbi:hypothetical protein EB796_000899 [Bugula neritina]|uniref:Uncharacterized protein n=1 Tax=Bugula neritina TaxID=10212 RepID=A0A7J7KRR2_BUGNE|nr:hypothetical protein EB796_000899 [Bugula neritina]